jgi:hypothetical protein
MKKLYVKIMKMIKFSVWYSSLFTKKIMYTISKKRKQVNKKVLTA